ncbi:MAG: Fe-Mn family superoxide dismutase [Paracoccaceae bacterium]
MSTHQKFQTYIPGQHSVRGIPFKAHKIDGFTPEMLEQHYEEIYGGAVRRLNEIETQISSGNQDRSLRLEQQAVANAVVLHEQHFESLGEDGGEDLADGSLKQAIGASFTSVAGWQADFSAMATSSTGGWVVLGWTERFGRLMNVRLGDDAQAMANLVPIIVLNMDAHAFSADFGPDKTAYVSAFLQSIHWARAAQRFLRSLGIATTPEEKTDPTQITISELKSRRDKNDEVLVLDVRHDDDCERYKNRITESEWHNSFDVAAWASDLPKDKPVVVYCMYGFWVSQKVAEELREHGIDARSLTGGVTAWRAMGYPSFNYGV